MTIHCYFNRSTIFLIIQSSKIKMTGQIIRNYEIYYTPKGSWGKRRSINCRGCHYSRGCKKLRSKHIMKKPLVLREMERVGLRVCVCVCSNRCKTTERQKRELKSEKEWNLEVIRAGKIKCQC